jgi:oligoribonuclease NrnB/cAMP/cGMP phosphodiesterase (DHH superfamily)
MINNCPDPSKFRIFDHHLTDIENLPDNFIICKDSPLREGKLSCATELYYLFLKTDPVFNHMITCIVPHNLSHFVQAVRIYDTFEFWLTRNDEDIINNIEYSDAPRLNLLFHILPREEFKEYIYDYIRNPIIDWMTLTTSTPKYPWISKVLQLESDKNKYYVEAALKKMIITPFKYDVYCNGKIHRFDYKCGVIFAEKNGPMIGNTACETNSEIDFCAVVTNNQVSMYTNRENIDVSEIARALGGGGHKAASGFTIPYQSSNIYAINHFCDIVKCAGKVSDENITL